MPTYYEILGIEHTASETEIQTAYETQYNRLRRLVTHHDPGMANKANQALQWLDKARGVLLDADMRQAYDAGIGLSGIVGGLGDPQALEQGVVSPGALAGAVMPAPPAPRSKTPVTLAQDRADAWICPKCQGVNAIGTRFCKHCGQQVGSECVNCGQLVQIDAEFCPACGVNIHQARRQKEMQAAAEQQRQKEAARREAEEKARTEAQERRMNGLRVGLGFLGAILGGIAAPLAWAAVWPDVMGEGFCIGVQVILGLIGGAIASVWAGGKAGESDSGTGFVVGGIMGILGGIFAFPVLVIGIVAGML